MAAHFGLWGRIELLERSLPFYKNALLAKSRELAARQGYEGARWIKCAGLECRQMPSYVEPFLIWQTFGMMGSGRAAELHCCFPPILAMCIRLPSHANRDTP
jgi:hypothetical protein